MSDSASRGSAAATLRKVPKDRWRAFFDLVSKALVGKRAEVEVASLDLGDQIVAEWVPLLGITYDSKDDLLDVALEYAGLASGSRLIRRPQEIEVEEGPAGVQSVAVLDADGVRHIVRHIVRLKDALMLPPAAAGG